MKCDICKDFCVDSDFKPHVYCKRCYDRATNRFCPPYLNVCPSLKDILERSHSNSNKTNDWLAGNDFITAEEHKRNTEQIKEHYKNILKPKEAIFNGAAWPVMGNSNAV